MCRKIPWPVLAASVLLFMMIEGGASAEQCSDAELMYDARNCGTCGNDCSADSQNSNWACDQGSCAFLGCQVGFYDPDGDESCDYACSFVSVQELCNGLDDDCDGLIDEDPVPPPASAVCDVSPSATRAECTTGVSITCDQGAWSCEFPAGVCVDGCSADDEICDLLDNDCDGSLNENVSGYGSPCRSDDGLPAPGHGRCATTGVYVCNGPGATTCSASPADCSTLEGGCTEACDGIDNDCDGLVDEGFESPGNNAGHFVRPAVTRYSANGWMFTYEASRPDATSTQPGHGNGYRCTGACVTLPPAPAGTALDGTVACSEPGRMPWAGVTPVEVEQACDALGGFICEASAYRTACEAMQGCDWGYSPAGPACTTSYTSTKFCNLSVSLDFDASAPGDQFGLLETASSTLLSCASDAGSSYPGNDQIFDMTGNVREIVKASSNVYPVMGGSYLTEVEQGATCQFDFMLGDGSYSSPDAGFRCCFDQDPSQ